MDQIKIDPDDKGVWRRLCCVWPRSSGKTLKCFYENLSAYAEKFPNEARPVIYCSKTMYKQVKKLPESYMRGRWLYINYKNKTFFVKEVRI